MLFFSIYRWFYSGVPIEPSFYFRGIPAPIFGCYHLGCCLPAYVNGDGTTIFIMIGSADDVLDSAILQPFKITIFAAHE